MSLLIDLLMYSDPEYVHLSIDQCFVLHQTAYFLSVNCSVSITIPVVGFSYLIFGELQEFIHLWILKSINGYMFYINSQFHIM